LELLTYVNGPTLTAGKNVQIIRSGNANTNCEQRSSEQLEVRASDDSQQDVISLPLAETMKGNENANPFVQAGDIISINEASQSFAYIIGNVKAAATVNLKEPVTLTKALAMAGGMADGAQIEKIKISRPVPGTLSKTEIIVNLKEISKNQREDVLLEPDDIIDVPGPSGTRKFLKNLIRVIIPAATGLPIIIP
jgi:hypothetical protein